jgi:hypothetical protein
MVVNLWIKNNSNFRIFDEYGCKAVLVTELESQRPDQWRESSKFSFGTPPEHRKLLEYT